MNDHEFIELLNLYVDHEISAEEASRLEAEVMSNPARRETYNQYCRMQKACLVLARTTNAFAPKPEPAADRLLPIRGWAGRLYVGGLVAAAACVVAALVVRQSKNVPSMAPVPSALVSSPGLAQLAPALQPAVLLKPVLSDQPEAIFAETGPLPHLNWISQVHIAPVQLPQPSDLVFAARPADLEPANQPIQAPRPIEGPAESTAFQFQK